MCANPALDPYLWCRVCLRHVGEERAQLRSDVTAELVKVHKTFQRHTVGVAPVFFRGQFLIHNISINQ